jgi:serine/threonine protein kinase
MKNERGKGSNRCAKCGLQIVTDSKEYSLTGFLLQSTRCKCLPDQAFADGVMSAKFYKLKQTGSGTIFAPVESPLSASATNSIDLAPGIVIGGSYKIIELIGRGGMGEVYLARHEALGKKCALKVIPPEQVTEIGWQRFQLEARAVAKLDHINLVRVTDLGIFEGCLPFYAMDYVEGKTLAQLLAEDGAMPLPTMLKIFMQVCDGVECAHRSGLLHRDLKPANLMVSISSTGTLQAKVLDFGLAKLISHDRTRQSLTAVGDIFGTPFYMSPEQCNGEILDNRSDIYALGCTMFECLTLQPPFVGHLTAAVIFGHLEGQPPSLESIVGTGKFPASIEVVMAKLLCKNPAERYQTLSHLRLDLELIAAGKDVRPVHISHGAKAVPVIPEPPLTEPPLTEPPLTEPPLTEPQPLLKPNQLPKLRQPKIRLFALGALAILASAGCWIYSRYLVSHEVVQLSKVDASRQGRSRQDSWSGFKTALAATESAVHKAITSVIATPDPPPLSYFSHKNDSGTTVFVFPAGATAFGQWSLDGNRYYPVVGPVEVPGVTRLFFKAGELFSDQPEMFRRFRPDDLRALILPPKYRWKSKHLAEIGSLKMLQELYLNQVLLKPSDLNLIDQLPCLIYLEVNDTGLTGKDLSQLSRLRQLQILRADVMENASPLLDKLQYSRSILRLSLKRAFLTDNDLKKIGGIASLVDLSIDDNPFSTAGLRSLVYLRNLRQLMIRNRHLGPESIEVLHGFKHLTDVRIDNTNWSAADKGRLLEALPRGCKLRDPFS